MLLLFFYLAFFLSLARSTSTAYLLVSDLVEHNFDPRFAVEVCQASGHLPIVEHAWHRQVDSSFRCRISKPDAARELSET